MRGSVRKRGSTWTWYLFELDPVTGKRQQRSKGGFRTKRECQEALNEALAACAREPSCRRPNAPSGASCLTSGFRPSGRPASGHRPGSATA
jgi:hypothetical protein